MTLLIVICTALPISAQSHKNEIHNLNMKKNQQTHTFISDLLISMHKI